MGGCCVISFRVGDIIVYGGKLGFAAFANSEVGRLQKVIAIEGRCYYTMFLDNGKLNEFDYGSDYFEDCEFVDGVGQYDNGVPVKWEDVI